MTKDISRPHGRSPQAKTRRVVPSSSERSPTHKRLSHHVAQAALSPTQSAHLLSRRNLLISNKSSPSRPKRASRHHRSHIRTISALLLVSKPTLPGAKDSVRWGRSNRNKSKINFLKRMRLSLHSIFCLESFSIHILTVPTTHTKKNIKQKTKRNNDTHEKNSDSRLLCS